MSTMNANMDVQKYTYCQILNIILLFFRHPSPSVLIPALRTVGNIVTGDDLQTEVLSSRVSQGLFFRFLIYRLLYVSS